jgi:hypothetical protein
MYVYSPEEVSIAIALVSSSTRPPLDLHFPPTHV